METKVFTPNVTESKDPLILQVMAIANFMELEGQFEDWCGRNIAVRHEGFIAEIEENTHYMQPYEPHKNVAQLWAVVEKIESMRTGQYHQFIVRIIGKYCAIECLTKENIPGKLFETPYMSTPAESKARAVYDIICKFVDFVNSGYSLQKLQELQAVKQ